MTTINIYQKNDVLFHIHLNRHVLITSDIPKILPPDGDHRYMRLKYEARILDPGSEDEMLFRWCTIPVDSSCPVTYFGTLDDYRKRFCGEVKRYGIFKLFDHAKHRVDKRTFLFPDEARTAMFDYSDCHFMFVDEIREED